SDAWSFAKVIVRADLAALDRGTTGPGELCEIAGQGPIPVADAWKIIDGGAFVAGIVTDGADIKAVQHLGRKPTALQRTVLEWETAGTCAVVGCTNRVAIEIDHVEDWADTLVTQIEHLAALCRSCHAKKTYEGFTLGPRLPTGKRKLIPPGQASNSPPGAPPGDAAVAEGPDEPEQAGLFDSG
ncbi:MAG TPA: HNH endonuclease signature motif containing protein, partial [Acidimicrobiales bacterium]